MSDPTPDDFNDDNNGDLSWMAYFDTQIVETADGLGADDEYYSDDAPADEG